MNQTKLMMNKLTGALLGLALLLGSCRSTTDEHNHTPVEHKTQATTADAVSDLEKTVLAVHDSAMADMSTLIQLQKAVKQKLNATASQLPAAEVTRQQAQGLAVTSALAKADEAMMGWMHGYNGDTLGKLDQEQAMRYLKDQQQKVNVMRALMVESMRSAKAYLK